MRSLALPLLAATLLSAVFVSPILVEKSMMNGDSRPAVTSSLPADVCFAPGTSPEYMARVQRQIWGDRSSLDYRAQQRWSYTVLDGNTGSQGHPIRLTYSFIPDSTMISDNWGNGPSQLFALLNQQFGSQQAWQAMFARIFAEWTAVTGVRYVQVSDDGAAFPNSAGQAGVRGDVRIGSKPLDGALNVLAYDYYPNTGDMVLDADENWGDTGSDHIFFRNIVAHEHGHGLGLAHVCPTDNTKLLEPYYTPAFNGPQHDDIRGGQRFYGDPLEVNDTPATATRLGSLTRDTILTNVGLDRNADVDWYKISLPALQAVAITLTPVGRSYLEGPQNGDGSCTAGSALNSLMVMDLNLDLFNSAGSVLLAQSHLRSYGEPERIPRWATGLEADSFLVKVSGTGANDVQLYQLAFDMSYADDPYLTNIPLNFDTVRVGSPRSLSTYLVNGAGYMLHIDSITTTPRFDVIPTGAHDLPVDDSIIVTVTYLAEQLGADTGLIRIFHNGPGALLEGQVIGFTGGASLRFIPNNRRDFGNVPVGRTDSVRIPIRAEGNIPLTIYQVSATPPFGISFTVPTTLSPTQSAFLWPSFAPTSIGAVDGIVLIRHTGSPAADTVYLHGNGTLNANDVPSALPTVFRLHPNYPNPFNPSTMLTFDLPHAADVHVQVFDIGGRLVQELAAGNLPAGQHAVRFDGTNLPSGVYLYRVSTAEEAVVGKMILLK
jgi:hypothetical protein